MIGGARWSALQVDHVKIFQAGRGVEQHDPIVGSQRHMVGARRWRSERSTRLAASSRSYLANSTLPQSGQVRTGSSAVRVMAHQVHSRWLRKLCMAWSLFSGESNGASSRPPKGAGDNPKPLPERVATSSGLSRLTRRMKCNCALAPLSVGIVLARVVPTWQCFRGEAAGPSAGSEPALS